MHNLPNQPAVTLYTYLYSRHSEIGYFKIDSDWWPALCFIIFHTGEAKVGSHQKLLPPLESSRQVHVFICFII